MNGAILIFQDDVTMLTRKLGSDIVIVLGAVSNIWVRRVEPQRLVLDKRTIWGRWGWLPWSPSVSWRTNFNGTVINSVHRSYKTLQVNAPRSELNCGGKQICRSQTGSECDMMTCRAVASHYELRAEPKNRRPYSAELKFFLHISHVQSNLCTTNGTLLTGGR